jgi:hypothetical protein
MDIKESQMNIATLDRLDRLNAIGSLASRIASTREDLIERQPEGFVVVGNENSMFHICSIARINSGNYP